MRDLFPVSPLFCLCMVSGRRNVLQRSSGPPASLASAARTLVAVRAKLRCGEIQRIEHGIQCSCMKKIDLRKQKRPNSSGKSHEDRTRRHRKSLAALDENRARSAINKRLVGWLFRNLSKNSREIQGQLICAAISQACLGHRRNPQAFDAGCGVPLEHYLLFKAARSLAGLIETQRRFFRGFPTPASLASAARIPLRRRSGSRQPTEANLCFLLLRNRDYTLIAHTVYYRGIIPSAATL